MTDQPTIRLNDLTAAASGTNPDPAALIALHLQQKHGVDMGDAPLTELVRAHRDAHTGDAAGHRHTGPAQTPPSNRTEVSTTRAVREILALFTGKTSDGLTAAASLYAHDRIRDWAITTGILAHIQPVPEPDRAAVALTAVSNGLHALGPAAGQKPSDLIAEVRDIVRVAATEMGVDL